MGKGMKILLDIDPALNSEEFSAMPKAA